MRSQIFESEISSNYVNIMLYLLRSLPSLFRNMDEVEVDQIGLFFLAEPITCCNDQHATDGYVKTLRVVDDI